MASTTPIQACLLIVAVEPQLLELAAGVPGALVQLLHQRVLQHLGGHVVQGPRPQEGQLLVLLDRETKVAQPQLVCAEQAAAASAGE